MGRARVLFVAPYPELAKTIERIAPEYPDVEADVRVGDLETGLAEALSAFSSNYDMVVSRGGTAQVLEDDVSVPVIEIKLSLIDVLRQLQDLGEEDLPVCAVGFENAVEVVRRAKGVLPIPVDVLSVSFADEVPFVVGRARSRGCKTLLCDTYAYEVARETGPGARLLASGDDSIRDAFEDARKLYELLSFARQREQLLWDLVHVRESRLVAFDSAGTLVYSALDPDEGDVIAFCKRHLHDQDDRRLTMKHGGKAYSIKPVGVTSGQTKLRAFGVATHGSVRSDRLVGIDFFNRAEAQDSYERSTFSTIGAVGPLRRRIDQALASSRPTLLRGEVGSGKEQIAKLLYLQSDVDGPMVTANFSVMGERSMAYLTESYRSPLYGEGQLIHLRDVNRLDEEAWHHLLETVQVSNAAARNRLVISGGDVDGSVAPAMEAFGERLRCFVLVAPPLRRHTDLIDDAARLWLERLARETSTDVPALDDDALDELRACPWPRNYIQFRQVLNWAFSACDGTTITSDDVREGIRREDVARFSSTTAAGDDSTIDLLRPLAEIERDVARIVVKSCDGNRTRAAETLGISRTTMWRLLKEPEDEGTGGTAGRH